MKSIESISFGFSHLLKSLVFHCTNVVLLDYSLVLDRNINSTRSMIEYVPSYPSSMRARRTTCKLTFVDSKEFAFHESKCLTFKAITGQPNMKHNLSLICRKIPQQDPPELGVRLSFQRFKTRMKTSFAQFSSALAC